MKLPWRVLVLIATMSLSNGLRASSDNGLTDEEKILGLSLIWKEAAYKFAHFDQIPELDWEHAYQQYIGLVLSSQSNLEYYHILQQFCALLKDGHTRVILSPQYRAAYDQPQIKLDNLNRKTIVTEVGVSLIDPIPVGSEILAVDSMPLHDYLKEYKFPYISCTPEHVLWTVGIRELLKGERNTSVEITLRTPAGESAEVTVVRNSQTCHESWMRSNSTNSQRLIFKNLEMGIDYPLLRMSLPIEIRYWHKHWHT